MIFSRHIAKLLVLIFLLFSSIAFAEDDENILEFDLGNLGKVTTFTGWKIMSKDKNQITLVCAKDSSAAEFSLLKNVKPERLKHFLELKAKKLGIPVNVRQVDKELREKNNIDNGMFILGTVEDNLTSPEKMKVRYWIIATSVHKKKCYILEAWSDSLPGGASKLQLLQRTWRFTD